METPPWFADCIRISPGDMPVVLDAPHGGSYAREGLRPRAKRKAGRDFLTLEYAYTLQERVRAACGQSPTIVACLLHRRYVDLNHTRSDSCDDPILKHFYDYYYARLQNQVTQCVNRWARCLLVDLHGFDPSNQPESLQNYDIIIGTRFNATITRSDRSMDPSKMLFIDALHEQGVAVFPPDESTLERRFTGGQIVAYFGENPFVPAIQVELSSQARGQDQDIKRRVLTAFAGFLKTWVIN